MLAGYSGNNETNLFDIRNRDIQVLGSDGHGARL
jgi:hypothetical protein